MEAEKKISIRLWFGCIEIFAHMEQMINFGDQGFECSPQIGLNYSLNVAEVSVDQFR